MKTIINVFKNLKNIESKPKRFLIVFSTSILIPEIIWSLGFFIFHIFFLISLIPGLEFIFAPVFTSDAVVLIIGPSTFYLYPFLGLISIVMLIEDIAIIYRNNGKLNSKDSVYHTLLAILNPSFLSFIYIVICMILTGFE